MNDQLLYLIYCYIFSLNKSWKIDHMYRWTILYILFNMTTGKWFLALENQSPFKVNFAPH